MNFEWDNKKEEANILKHGVSFSEAGTVFEDANALEIPDPDSDPSEDRFVTIGYSAKYRVLVVINILKIDTEEVSYRIISARKATTHERRFYERRI